jgi:hypothetical protein
MSGSFEEFRLRDFPVSEGDVATFGSVLVEAARLLQFDGVDPKQNPVYEALLKLEGTLLGAAGLAEARGLNSQLTHTGLQLEPIVRAVRRVADEG